MMVAINRNLRLQKPAVGWTREPRGHAKPLGAQTTDLGHMTNEIQLWLCNQAIVKIKKSEMTHFPKQIMLQDCFLIKEAEGTHVSFEL